MLRNLENHNFDIIPLRKKLNNSINKNQVNKIKRKKENENITRVYQKIDNN